MHEGQLQAHSPASPSTGQTELGATKVQHVALVLALMVCVHQSEACMHEEKGSVDIQAPDGWPEMIYT
jgi:hypothetical protein